MIVKIFKSISLAHIIKIVDAIILQYPVDVDWARHILAHVPSKHQLSVFMHIYRELPAQLSDQWRVDRVHKIGGSSVAGILGEGYSSAKKTVRSIFGLSDFNGNAATNWGTLLEPVANRFVEDMAGIKIIETGSIPGFTVGNRVATAYSPDGISWLPPGNRIESLLGIHTENVNVLWEFKCPYRRVPRGKIPKHYVAQPLMGLVTLPIPLEFAVFGDYMIRACSLTDLNFGKQFVRHSHEKLSGPIAIVIFAFYSNKRMPKLHQLDRDIDAEKYRKYIQPSNTFEKNLGALLTALDGVEKHKAAYVCRELLTSVSKEDDGDITPNTKKLSTIHTAFDVLGLDLIDLCGSAHPWFKYCNTKMRAKIIAAANNGKIKTRCSKIFYAPPQTGWRAVIEDLLCEPERNIGIMACKIIDAHFSIVDDHATFANKSLPKVFDAAKKINSIIGASNVEELIDKMF